MESKENKRNEKYAYLNRLSTEKLEEMLRLDTELSENSDDIEYIDAIEKVILQREKEQPSGRIANIDRAWQEFQTYYNTEEGLDAPLSCADMDGEHPKLTNIDKTPSHTTAHHRRIKFKQIVAVAAVVAAIFAGMVGAQASGLDIFGALARWTSETFHYDVAPDSSGQNSSNLQSSESSQEYYSSFKDALKACGIDESLSPSWYPKRFVIDDEVEIYTNDISSSVYFSLIDPDNHILGIEVYQCVSPEYLNSWVFEKDETKVERYMSNYRNFYILSNNNSYTATWSDGKSIMVNIWGELSKDEIKTIIDSMGG